MKELHVVFLFLTTLLGDRLDREVRPRAGGGSYGEPRISTPIQRVSSARGWWVCSTTQALTMAKNPDRRRFATTIIMPNNRISVS